MQNENDNGKRIDLRELYKAKQYGKIIDYWSKLQQTPESLKNAREWDLVYIMNAFNALKRYDECLRCYKVYNKLYPTKHSANNTMGWALYHLHIKDFDPKKDDPERLKKQVDIVILKCHQEDRSPRWGCIKVFCDYIEDGKLGEKYGLQLVPEYLEKIDPRGLSDILYRPEKSDGKQGPGYSNKENWYSMKSKALLNLARYEECLECCNEGLRNIGIYHNGSDAWLKYRKARALQMLGYAEEAAVLFREVKALGLRHYVIDQYLFEEAVRENKTDEALTYGCRCALFDEVHRMRVKYYIDFAEFLDKCGKKEEAMLLHRFITILREENGWKAAQGSKYWQISEEINSMPRGEVLSRLKSFWQQNMNAGKQYHFGVVKSVQPVNMRFGFITDNAGGEYFFGMNEVKGNKQLFRPGTKVRYILEDKLDRKKNIVKPAAVNVEIVADRGE